MLNIHWSTQRTCKPCCRNKKHSEHRKIVRQHGVNLNTSRCLATNFTICTCFSNCSMRWFLYKHLSRIDIRAVCDRLSWVTICRKAIWLVKNNINHSEPIGTIARFSWHQRSDFPHLLPAAWFPVLGNSGMISRAWYE